MSTHRFRSAALVLAVVQLLVASSIVGYRWVATASEADIDSALTEFRQRQTPAPDRAVGDLELEAPSVTDDAVPVVTPPPAPAQPGGGTPAPAPQAPAAEPAPAAQGPDLRPPDPGVYEWDTQGWEQAAGIRREFPSRSVRIITSEGPNRWMNEHRYSSNHVEWFPFELSEQGMFCPSYRNSVRFGPISADNTVTYNPPARFMALPLAVGTTWNGSWDGDIHGTYEGRIFEHTTLHIAGQDVEVWGSELTMHMSGDFDGTVEAKIWFSPEHRMSVRESYRQEVSARQGTYRGEWTITLVSLRPQQ